MPLSGDDIDWLGVESYNGSDYEDEFIWDVEGR